MTNAQLAARPKAVRTGPGVSSVEQGPGAFRDARSIQRSSPVGGGQLRDKLLGRRFAMASAS